MSLQLPWVEGEDLHIDKGKEKGGIGVKGGLDRYGKLKSTSVLCGERVCSCVD